MGYPRGWSQEELIRFRRTCLLFWMLPRSGLRLRRNMSSCCCPAQRPRTHSLLTYRSGVGGRRKADGVGLRLLDSTCSAPAGPWREPPRLRHYMGARGRFHGETWSKREGTLVSAPWSEAIRKEESLALAVWLRWWERHPVHQRVEALIPAQGACLGLPGFNPQLGRVREATDGCFSPVALTADAATHRDANVGAQHCSASSRSAPPPHAGSAG